jgi:hypothetical protein
MTLQSDNGEPSFYTFTAFRPGKIALLYGGLLTILSFCVVVFLFNYGIREKLWSFETVSYGSINPSPASASDSNQNPMQAQRTIKRVALSDSTIHSLVGSYFSATANHKYAITLEGDRLNLRIDAQTGMELIPVSDHSLYANQDLAIEFRAANGGKVYQLDIYDRGRHFVAARQ